MFSRSSGACYRTDRPPLFNGRVRMHAVVENRAWPVQGSHESLGVDGTGRTAPMEAVGCALDNGQEAKPEILAEKWTRV